MSAIQTLTEFVQGAPLRPLDAGAIQAAKPLVLDLLGVTVAGSGEPVAQIARGFVSGFGGRPVATVVGTPRKAPSSLAAMANGTMAHALDYDDGDDVICGHPSAPILPAALAVGEEEDASGPDVLRAYILGIDVAAALGSIVNPRHYERGWHSTCTLGVFGATAAAATLFRLNEAEIRNALSIASSAACGLKRQFGYPMKPLQVGRAAEAGVNCARLAKLGLAAAPESLEGARGFLELYQASEASCTRRLEERLAGPHHIVANGIRLKRYPSCGSTHNALDALLGLMSDHGIDQDDVTAVECGVDHLRPLSLIFPDPTTGLQGKFSMEFCIAVALRDREVRLDHFSDHVVVDPSVRRLMSRVRVYVHPDYADEKVGLSGCLLTLRLRDGRTLERFVESPLGSPRNPLSWEAVAAKFADCATYVGAPGLVEPVVSIVGSLDTIGSIRVLGDALGTHMKSREAEVLEA